MGGAEEWRMEEVHVCKQRFGSEKLPTTTRQTSVGHVRTKEAAMIKSHVIKRVVRGTATASISLIVAIKWQTSSGFGLQ